jgi:hypothetical protein
MSDGEWGVGSRESEHEASSPAQLSRAPLPTPHTPQPTPRSPNWNVIYGIVLGELAILIAVFYAFTKAFA